MTRWTAQLPPYSRLPFREALEAARFDTAAAGRPIHRPAPSEPGLAEPTTPGSEGSGAGLSSKAPPAS